MSQVLVQLSERSGTVKRVKPGEDPVVELHLSPNQRVVSLRFREALGMGERKTRDWLWWAIVETRCAEEAPDDPA